MGVSGVVVGRHSQDGRGSVKQDLVCGAAEAQVLGVDGEFGERYPASVRNSPELGDSATQSL